jgi:two-component system, OmpR family, alkaline phosphatase synthesis response regulator PhoP
MSFKILVIEDEISLAETLKLNLELENYSVSLCNHGGKAIEEVSMFQPDLILLDIMLPEINGVDIYKTIRESGNNVPVIFLTAKNQFNDKIEGLKLGADDYVTKPFDLEELLLRINIILKRAYPNTDNQSSFKFENGEINFSTYEVVTKDKQTETLSKREIALLKLLIDNQNQVVSRDDIIYKLWHKDENPSSRTIDNYILSFRKLFEPNPKEPIHFLSIRGVGYKFCI